MCLPADFSILPGGPCSPVEFTAKTITVSLHNSCIIIMYSYIDEMFPTFSLIYTVRNIVWEVHVYLGLKRQTDYLLLQVAPLLQHLPFSPWVHLHHVFLWQFH